MYSGFFLFVVVFVKPTTLEHHTADSPYSARLFSAAGELYFSFIKLKLCVAFVAFVFIGWHLFTPHW